MPTSSRLTIQTVLFPTDESPTAEAARAVAARLARRHGAALHVLRVEIVPPAGDLRPDRELKPDTTTAGVVYAVREFPNASDAILDYADEVGADVIVMGTHGRGGVNRLTLGSTAESVLRQSECPVLTVGPEAGAEADGPVLAPLAFESSSDLALETAVAFAAERGTRVVALHVVEPIEIPVPYGMTMAPLNTEALEARVAEVLERWTSTYGAAPIEPLVRVGPAAPVICKVAEEVGAGLIVQSSHGRRGIGRWLLGSVAEAVARRAPCPVFTQRLGGHRRLWPQMDMALAVPRADWPDLFDALSRRAAATPCTVSVDVVSPEATGAVFRDASLIGVTYDPENDELDVIVQGGEHHVMRPFAVRSEAGAWSIDVAQDARAPGPWSLEIIGADGARERLSIQPMTTPVEA